MERSTTIPLVAVVLALLAPAAGAAPADAGIIADPESPSGKEYAIPLDQARAESSPEHGARGTAQHPAPPFGAGISQLAQRSSGSQGPRGADEGNGGARSPGDQPSSAAAAPSWWIWGIGSLVVAAGFLAGVALRRLRPVERGV